METNETSWIYHWLERPRRNDSNAGGSIKISLHAVNFHEAIQKRADNIFVYNLV